MTVRELIAKLAEFPQDAVIVRHHPETEDVDDIEVVEQLDLIQFRQDIPRPHPWSSGILRTFWYYPDYHGWDREPYLGKFDRLTGVCIR